MTHYTFEIPIPLRGLETGPPAHYTVRVSIDFHRVAREMGRRARRNTSSRSREMYGALRAMIVPNVSTPFSIESDDDQRARDSSIPF